MESFKKIAISLALLSSLVAGQKTSQASTHPDTTNVIDKIQEMLQRDPTPTKWAETAAEHQQLPSTSEMPRTDKIARARMKQIYLTEFLQVQTKVNLGFKHFHLTPDWGHWTSKHYADGTWEFELLAHTNDQKKNHKSIIYRGARTVRFDIAVHRRRSRFDIMGA